MHISIFKIYLRNDYAEDYLWWLAALKYEKYCHILPKNLSNIYLGGQNRSLNFFKNYISLYKIYKHNFKLSNLNIIKIYALLSYRTLAKKIGEPKTELNYRNPYTFLVSVVLSAQATDKSVNNATRDLFKIVKDK